MWDSKPVTIILLLLLSLGVLPQMIWTSACTVALGGELRLHPWDYLLGIPPPVPRGAPLAPPHTLHGARLHPPMPTCCRTMMGRAMDSIDTPGVGLATPPHPTPPPTRAHAIHARNEPPSPPCIHACMATSLPHPKTPSKCAHLQPLPSTCSLKLSSAAVTVKLGGLQKSGLCWGAVPPTVTESTLLCAEYTRGACNDCASAA